MSRRSAGPSNPWGDALGVVAVLLLLAGLITVSNSGPDLGDAVPTTGQVVGAGLLNLGALTGLAFIVVKALLWGPGAGEPAGLDRRGRSAGGLEEAETAEEIEDRES